MYFDREPLVQTEAREKAGTDLGLRPAGWQSSVQAHRLSTVCARKIQCWFRIRVKLYLVAEPWLLRYSKQGRVVLALPKFHFLKLLQTDQLRRGQLPHPSIARKAGVQIVFDTAVVR